MPSRVTIRGAAPGSGDSTALRAEVLGYGVQTMHGASRDEIPNAATYAWLHEHRTVLVQPDCRKPPQPPRMLTEHFRVGAQMLGPLFRGDSMIGTVSVHHEGGPRAWTDTDVMWLRAAVERVNEAWLLQD